MRRKSYIIISFLCMCLPWVCAGGNEGVLTSKIVNHPGGTITVEKVSDLVVNLIATPAAGYTFLQWSDGITDSIRQHTQTPQEYSGDVGYYAVFVLTQDVQMADGHVDVSVNPLVPDADLSYQLTAVANSDAEFYMWNNAVTTKTISYQEAEGTRVPFFINNAGNLSFAYQNHPGGVVVGTASGLNATLTATPNAGYEFYGWTDGETSPTRSYTHSETAPDVTFCAVFKKTEDFTWEDGQVTLAIKDATTPSFTLTATANPNVDFYMWNNAVDTPSVTYVEEEGTRTPIFISQLGTVTISYEQHPGGVVWAEKFSNQQFTFHANANEGYSFVKWSDDVTDSVRSYTHMAFGSDAYFWAIFTRDEDIYVQDGHTEVTVTNVAQDKLSYSLAAAPDEFAEFYAWSHGVEDSIITYLESDGTRVPSFISSIGTLSLFFDPHAGGIIKAEQISGLTYRYIAIPNEGYSFLSWADGVTDSIRVYSHTEVAPDTSFLAVFTRDEDVRQTYGYTSVAITDSKTPKFDLTAHEAEGASFYIWTNGSENPTVSYVEENGNVIPFFINESGNLTFTFDPHAGGIVAAENIVGLSCDLVAVPAPGYRFIQWADGSKDSVRHYTHTNNPNADSVRFAVFEKIADVEFNEGKVTVVVTDSLTPSYSLTATAYSCVGFDSWVNGKTSETISYSESEGQCFPIFSYGDKKILVDVDDEVGGHVEVTPGACKFTLEAIPTEGWSFSYWEDDHSLPTTREVEYLAQEYYAYFSKAAFRVGDTYYIDFADAEQAADATNPVVLEADVTDIVLTQNVPIDANGHTITNLIVSLGTTMAFTTPMTVTNLYLNATTGSSSQLKNYALKLVNTNAYIDIKLEANATSADPNKWYGFSVPFEVDVETGIARTEGSASHVSGTDYLVWNYDGNKRATTGTGWVKMYGGTLEPGKFYMIGIDGTQNVWRFTKKSGSALGGAATIDLPAYTGSEIDGGWNAVGNSTVQYVTASITDIPYVQAYNNSQSRYVPKLTDRTSFVVGCPFFVQVEGENSLTLSPSDETNPTNLYAPRRMGMNNATSIYEITLSDDVNEDVVFISAADDALDSYQRGKDLVKLSYSSQYPQIFSCAYGQILCAQHSPLGEDGTIFLLYLSVPKSGMYEISASQGECPIYLLENNVPIAEISESSYLLSLPSGITTKYSVSIGTQRTLPMGMNTNKADAESIDKFILNNRLFIICGDKVYNAQGSQVR